MVKHSLSIAYGWILLLGCSVFLIAKRRNFRPDRIWTNSGSRCLAVAVVAFASLAGIVIDGFQWYDDLRTLLGFK